MDSVALWLYLDEIESNERVQRRIIRDRSDVLSLSNKSFVKNFRLSKEAFMYVLNIITPELRDCQRSTSIPAIKRLSATLKILGQGGNQHQIGQDQYIGMAQPTMSTAMYEVCCAIEKTLCKKHIVFQMSESGEREAKKYFHQKFGIAGTIGIVDGTHIQMIKPTTNEHLYLNRKLKHSVNAMVICDHRMIIRAVDARFGGASDDSNVWNNSNERRKLKERFENDDKKTRILADSEYPLEPWLLTPYRDAAENSAEAVFNAKLTKASSIIERVFDVLKARFRCLLSANEMHYSPEKVVRIVNVCCALHNICVAFNVEQPLIRKISKEADESSISVVLGDCDSDLSNIARNIREEIKNAMT